MTDAEKLRKLAEWLDLQDYEVGNADNEVQKDLRRIADELEPPTVLQAIRKEMIKLGYHHFNESDAHDVWIAIHKFSEEESNKNALEEHLDK